MFLSLYFEIATYVLPLKLIKILDIREGVSNYRWTGFHLLETVDAKWLMKLR